MPSLELWKSYDRRAAHDIFEPQTTFTPQTGTWGLQGIVKIAGTQDFVFFVTFGKSQGGHSFDEGVSADGVLTWQSQPQQKLDSPRIRQFIAHDELVSNIHLFLRTSGDQPYTYLGRLGYLDHDPGREQPVYFTWQLLDGPVPQSTVQQLHLPLTPPADPVAPLASTPNTLTQTPPPAVGTRGKAGGAGGGPKHAYLPGRDAKNHELGLKGERLVLRHEVERLTAAGRIDLASKVVHVSVLEGDSAGYDIRSFNDDASDRHVEVKTTRGPASNAFFISPNELSFSKSHPLSYVLVRVSSYDDGSNSGNYYEKAGPVDALFELTESEYRARLKP